MIRKGGRSIDKKAVFYTFFLPLVSIIPLLLNEQARPA